jgi:RHS repeat-associated protein
MQAVWSGVVSGSVTREYDDLLRVSRMIYPGADLSLAYDMDDLLTDVGSVSITRDADNGMVAGISDGGFSMTYTRNPHGEIETATAAHGGVLYDASTTYDDLGRISMVSETIGGSTHTWSYDYDAVGQLVQVLRDGLAVESYAYDDTGNRTTVANTLTGASLGSGDFSYDLDHKLLAAGTTAYAYDADGRLTGVDRNGSVTGFQYNTDGTLAAVTLPDSRVITYLHDARGRRITRAVDGSRTHAWIYGDGRMPLAEFDAAGSLKRSFIYAVGDTPTAFVEGGRTYHIVSDHLGSPRLIVDDSGVVVRRIDYDAFGNVVGDSHPGLDLPFGFAGGMADPDHELIRFGVRDYQPSTGRWTARDPILFEGGLNLYMYVQNDPVNLIDPEGTLVFADIVLYIDTSLHNLIHPNDQIRLIPKTMVYPMVKSGQLDIDDIRSCPVHRYSDSGSNSMPSPKGYQDNSCLEYYRKRYFEQVDLNLSDPIKAIGSEG